MESGVNVDVSPGVRQPVNVPALDPWRLSVWNGESSESAWRHIVRRYLNVVVAAVGLIVLSPILLLVALGIRLSSPGPILFRQVRVGLDRRSPFQASSNWRREVDYGGELFTLYKFRTMNVDGETSGQVWAARNDPRVFPFGRFLRKYRLDELPQLFNVLRGDMNVVGPRPEQPEIFLELRRHITRYPDRQRVLPGITGLAQVNHHYDTCIDDVRTKVSYDLEYIGRLSALEDLRILVQTLPSVVLKKNGW